MASPDPTILPTPQYVPIPGSPGRVRLTAALSVPVAGQRVEIYQGFESDGLSIPTILLWLLGARLAPKTMVAALVHDLGCVRANSRRCWETRLIADAQFLWCLKRLRVPYWRRTLMFLGVVLYGRWKMRYILPAWNTFLQICANIQGIMLLVCIAGALICWSALSLDNVGGVLLRECSEYHERQK